MKKLLRIAVVLGLVLCLSVTALAAGSPQGVKVEKAVTADGQQVAVSEQSSAITLTPQQAADAINAAVEAIGANGDEVEAPELTVAWLKDVHVEIPAGGSVTITFDVPGATDDQNVYVLHYENGGWVKVGEGKGSVVTATFTSLSPVAIVVEKPASTASAVQLGSNSTGVTSPVTGEGPMLLVAAVVALLAGTVAVVTLKKTKKEM